MGMSRLDITRCLGTPRRSAYNSSVVTSQSTPPPSRTAFPALLRMHKPLTSMFGRRLLCLWGQFVGTCSHLAYAAHAGWRGHERSVRWGFVTSERVGGPVRRHALRMPTHLPYSKCFRV